MICDGRRDANEFCGVILGSPLVACHYFLEGERMTGRNIGLRILTLFVALTIIVTQVPAQSRTDSNLRVSVTDATGATIIAAKISIKSADGNQQLVETNQNGEVLATSLKPGNYIIRVEAEGFAPKEIKDYKIKPGNNRIEVRLDVAGVNEVEVISEDKQERSSDLRSDKFTTVLTPAEIDKLPDDPEELEEALRQMAGPGATLRVNGFTGGRLPPKSQIREIRFRLDPFAAENHDASFFGIDIFTKPGIDNWHSSVNLGFRDESFNSRNAFAPVRAPEQTRRYAFTLDGPLWKNRTSLFLAADGADNYDSSTIVAALPDGQFSDVFQRPSRKLNLSARIEHALTKTHTARFEYQRNARIQENLGVGNFDLFSRAYTNDQAEHVLRVADSGMIGKKLLNEFRFQTRWQEIENTPATNDQAIIVLNAFSQGGAQIEGTRSSRDIEIADNIDFTTGKHSMRGGILFEAGHYDSDNNSNPGGTFTFASLEDFLASRPTTFTQRVGDPQVKFNQYQFAWYWQDNYRLSKSLSLSYGVRHEIQSNIDDNNNFAPRFGLAWSPFRDGKTTIRAGAGIFYDWLSAPTFEQTLRVDGIRQREIVVQNPGFPNPFSGGMQITLPPSRIQISPDLRMPYVAQSSVGLQRDVIPGLTLRANYFYTRGSHLLRGRNINAPLPGEGRPDPTVGNITQVESTANSFTHSLNIGVNFNSMKRRMFGAVNYLLSKSTNEADSPFSLPANNLDLSAERGPAITDARHRLFGMLNFEPFKGIGIGTMFNYSSATPYNITTGFDDNGDSIITDRPDGVGRNSARGASQWNVNMRLGYSFGFGNRPESNAQGATPRIVRIGGGDESIPGMPSMSLASKRYRMEFYTQVFNVLNHTNPTNFSGVLTSPFFGQATAALPGRRLEFGTRFSF